MNCWLCVHGRGYPTPGMPGHTTICQRYMVGMKRANDTCARWEAFPEAYSWMMSMGKPLEALDE